MTRLEASRSGKFVLFCTILFIGYNDMYARGDGR